MSREAIGRSMEILLVEDSLVAARLAMGALTRSGLDHRLSWVSDGDDARAFLLQQKHYARAPRPDLILLDLHLPAIDGRTLLKEVRESSSLRDVPVVIMTGSAGEHAEDEFRTLDVQGFLTKPLDVDKFLLLVDQLKTYWKADMLLHRELG